MDCETYGANHCCGPWLWRKSGDRLHWLVLHSSCDGQGQFLADNCGLSHAVVDDFGLLVRVAS